MEKTTEKNFVAEAEKRWQEKWKENPPKCEGRIFIGDDEKNTLIQLCITADMYPAIINALLENDQIAFLTAILMRCQGFITPNFAQDVLNADDSEDGEGDETPE